MYENLLQQLTAWQNQTLLKPFTAPSFTLGNTAGNFGSNYKPRTPRESMSYASPLPSNALNSNKLDPMDYTPAQGFKHNNKEKGKLWQGIGGFGGAAKLGSSALDLVSAGSDKLDNVSGASNILNMGSKIAGMVPGPIGQGISFGLKAITTADQLLGKNAATQATEGMTASGYNLNFNEKASTKYGGLFGNKARKTADSLTQRQDSQNIRKKYASYGVTQNMKAASNSMQDVATKNYNKLQGGYRTNILAAKSGTKLTVKNIAQEVKRERSKNVIPSGALHARKNNLPDKISEHVTHKGIPVISKNEKGDIIQHAEIEHSELILTKEITDKLEALLKKDTDASTIEAGKLLTFEILENTEDNTNLIEST